MILKKKEENKKQPRYKSQQGYVIVPLVRGFTEIKPFFEALRFLETDAFICGGYARYCASPNMGNRLGKAGDVDVYCPTEKQFTIVRKFFDSQLGKRHENEMAITYSRTREGTFRMCPTLQLIKPIKEGRVVAVGAMTEILDNFDFTVVRAAIINESEVMVDADFMHDEERKILRLKNIHCPISSTLRCMKYAAKGYWLPPRQALSLFLDWDNRTDEYRGELISFVLRIDNDEKLTKEEINKFEALMRRD